MDNFIKSIMDKKGRLISIGGNGNNIVAEHDEIEVGCFEFDYQDNESSCIELLTNCHIAVNYQRSGIGTEMMLLAEEWHEDFCIVNHLAVEGASFLNFCTVNNIFKFGHSSVNDDRY